MFLWIKHKTFELNSDKVLLNLKEGQMKKRSSALKDEYIHLCSPPLIFLSWPLSLLPSSYSLYSVLCSQKGACA